MLGAMSEAERNAFLASMDPAKASELREEMELQTLLGISDEGRDAALAVGDLASLALES